MFPVHEPTFHQYSPKGEIGNLSLHLLWQIRKKDASPVLILLSRSYNHRKSGSTLPSLFESLNNHDSSSMRFEEYLARCPNRIGEESVLNNDLFSQKCKSQKRAKFKNKISHGKCCPRLRPTAISPLVSRIKPYFERKLSVAPSLSASSRSQLENQ